MMGGKRGTSRDRETPGARGDHPRGAFKEFCHPLKSSFSPPKSSFSPRAALSERINLSHPPFPWPHTALGLGRVDFLSPRHLWLCKE